MKILLIQADRDAGKYKYVWKFFIPSLTLEQIAACTPPQHEIKFINEWYEKTEFDEDYDLVAISAFTKDAFRAYEIADEFRRRGIKVVLGGYHPTALPIEAKKHADAVVIGEAETTWQALLKDAEKGSLKPYYYNRKASNFPPAKRISSHPFFSAVQATRGCPYRCQFCQLTGFRDNIHRKRDVKDVINEISSLPTKIFWFHDASLTIDTRYSKSLFKEMIRRKIKKRWIAFGNLAVLSRDEEFLRLASKAGCIAWMVGLETVSQKTINEEIKKGGNKIDRVSSMIDKAEREGMEIWASFIFGFDNDDAEIFDTTYEKLNEWGIKVAEFNILTPFPKTPIFKKLLKERRIFTFDWSKYDLRHVVFEPKQMETKELEREVKRISRKFFSLDKILARSILSKHKILSFLANYSIRTFIYGL